MNEYIGRINKVIDHIENNLDKSFTLEELAKIAHFSKFHFHRLFLSIMGETLFRFIQRVRLERAANRLTFEPKIPITAIAMDCGFSSSASFSNSFKESFKTSPRDWRKKSLFSNQIQQNSNLNKKESNQAKETTTTMQYLGNQNNVQKWKATARDKTQLIEVFDRPETHVIYVRHVGAYKQDFDLFEDLNTRLFNWAAPRGLINFPDTEYLIICHDDPELTNEEKLRISVCLSVDKDIEANGEIGKMIVPAGKYAQINFRIKPLEIGAAWNWVYCCWLPVSGFIPDDRPSFELYPMDGSISGDKDDIDLIISIPVKLQ